MFHFSGGAAVKTACSRGLSTTEREFCCFQNKHAERKENYEKHQKSLEPACDPVPRHRAAAHAGGNGGNSSGSGDGGNGGNGGNSGTEVGKNTGGDGGNGGNGATGGTGGDGGNGTTPGQKGDDGDSGFKVSGRVSGYIVVDASTAVDQIDADTDAATVSLYMDGNETPVYTTTASSGILGVKTGSYSTTGGVQKATYEVTASYTLTGVPAGTYTMKVQKKNNATRSYTVTVAADHVSETGAVTQDVDIKLIGDVNGDGKIRINDVGLLYNHFRGASLLSGYELSCGDVIGNDGQIKINDVGLLYGHFAGKQLVWSD